MRRHPPAASGVADAMAQQPAPRRAHVSLALKVLGAAFAAAAILAAMARHTLHDGTPLVVIGLITDAQYADIPDGKSAAGVPRYYRDSLRMVQAAATAWAMVPATAGGIVAAVHVGDAVDGKAAVGPGGGTAAVAAVQAALRSAGVPVHYVLGNHEFSLGNRSALAQRYGFVAADDGAAYRSLAPAPGVRLLLLDSYAESVVGWPAGDARHAQAQQVLSGHNPLPAGGAQNDPGKLRGFDRRWVRLGGALGATQLAWLDAQLQRAAAAGERVIVFSHVPLHPKAVSNWCGPLCLSWDYEDALAVLRRHGGTVAACVAGHDHFGAATRDGESGIAFITLQAVIETQRGGASHGELRLYERQLRLTGSGRMRSRRFFLPPLPPAEQPAL